MDTAELLKMWDRKFQEIKHKDETAKRNNKLVGRYIRMPVADGHAFYEIVRENRHTVRIEHISGLGDDWKVSYWGDRATIRKDFALENIGFRDRLAEVFRK